MYARDPVGDLLRDPVVGIPKIRSIATKLRSTATVSEQLGLHSRVQSLSACARAPAVVAGALCARSNLVGLLTLAIAGVASRAAALRLAKPADLLVLLYREQLGGIDWQGLASHGALSQFVRLAPEQKIVGELERYAPNLLPHFQQLIKVAGADRRRIALDLTGVE